MTLNLNAANPPLALDADGVVRVSGSRIALDTVVAAFRQGATAEEIVQQYPSLTLADVYATLGYYLGHQDEIDVYLQERARHAKRVREQNESRFDPEGIRDRLQARAR